MGALSLTGQPSKRNPFKPLVKNIKHVTFGDISAMRKAVKEKFDILLAGGQDHLKGKVFRIGHLGFVCDRDVLTAVAAIEATLQDLGLHKGSAGAGVAACAAALAS